MSSICALFQLSLEHGSESGFLKYVFTDTQVIYSLLMNIANQIAFDFWVLILTLLNSADRPRGANAKLIVDLQRDGGLFFFVSDYQYHLSVPCWSESQGLFCKYRAITYLQFTEPLYWMRSQVFAWSISCCLHSQVYVLSRYGQIHALTCLKQPAYIVVGFL